MPIYEYHCDDCDNSFEALIRPGHDDDAACPQCHSAHLSREMSVFSSSAGVDGYSPSSSGFTQNRGGGGCCGGGCGCN